MNVNQDTVARMVATMTPEQADEVMGTFAQAVTDAANRMGVTVTPAFTREFMARWAAAEGAPVNHREMVVAAMVVTAGARFAA